MRPGTSTTQELGGLSRDVLAGLVEITDEDDGVPRERAIAAITEANAACPDRWWERAGPDSL